MPPRNEIAIQTAKQLGSFTTRPVPGTKRYYVVHREPWRGIYSNWSRFAPIKDRYDIYCKGYDTWEDAVAALRGNADTSDALDLVDEFRALDLGVPRGPLEAPAEYTPDSPTPIAMHSTSTTTSSSRTFSSVSTISSPTSISTISSSTSTSAPSSDPAPAPIYTRRSHR